MSTPLLQSKSQVSNQPSARAQLHDNVVTLAEFAALLHINENGLHCRRHRDPHGFPAPFLHRPLLWRIETVQKWMADQEKEGEKRLALRYRAKPKQRRQSAAVPTSN